MPRIFWSRGQESGRFELTGPITFGRDDDNVLVVPDPRLSRMHASIEPDDSGGWWVVDRGSSNGLFFGGAKVDRIDLRDGAEFLAGDTRFRFEADGGRAVDRTVLAETVVDAAPVVPPPLPPSPAATPSAVAPPPLSPPVAPRPADSRRIGILAAAAVVLGLVILSAWFLLHRSPSDGTAPETAGASPASQENAIATLEKEMTSRQYAVRWQAYRKLKAMGRKPDPGPLWILDLETHPDDDVREAAAEKLGKAHYTAAIPNLRRAEKDDSDWNVRNAAEDALEEMGVE